MDADLRSAERVFSAHAEVIPDLEIAVLRKQSLLRVSGGNSL